MARKPFPSKPSIGRILIVEDSRTDRDLLRYLLESRFRDTVVLEATTLQRAINMLERETIGVVILDLQLPDSTGANTFNELSQRFPGIPLVVMTHNKDRHLAIEMIQQGAADYLIKDFTDEDQIFSRILFAIEKHKRSLRVTPEDAASVRRLERAEAHLKSAHESGQHSAIRETTVEMNAAMADLSRRMFAELQGLTTQVTLLATNGAATAKIVENLDVEILRGAPGRTSMKSQMDLVTHRLTANETKLKELEKKTDDEAEKMTHARLSNRTKIVIAVLSLLGIIGGAVVSYLAATHKVEASTEKSSGEKK